MPRNPFGSEHAAVYEAMYRAKGKDWNSEAKTVVRLARALNPAAAALLDVGCGTGAHLEEFVKLFDTVAGLDASSDMLRHARHRLPTIDLHTADMRSFDLGRSFDVVTCLFTSIAYLGTEDELRRAVRAMVRHLSPSGVVLVEPWWSPEHFIDGYLGADIARTSERVISRVSRTTAEGGRAVMDVEWTVGDHSGLRRFAETEVFSMFSHDTYRRAFQSAGCTVAYDAGFGAYGLFVAQRG